MVKSISESVEKNSPPGDHEPLSKKVARGGIWVFSLRGINRGFSLVRTIILARLLPPEDFGLLGIALLAVSSLETFSQTGFQAALIQRKENVEDYLDTAWTVSVIRGGVLFLILFLFAPLIAGFFSAPSAVWVIRAIAISFLLSGFQNIGILFFQKELEFNKQFVYELSGTAADLAVAVSFAIILRNVWALVWGMLAAGFCRLIVSYFVHGYRPGFKFNKGQFKELFNFGQWILGSSILTFLVTQGDDVFIGKFIGVTALGLYQLAYLVSNLPATEISHVVSRLTFPAFSKIQDQSKRIGEAFLQVFKITVCIAAPITGGIFVLAADFTNLFLGEKWLPIIPLVKLLVVAGFIRSLAAIAVPVFHGIGKPKIDMAGQVIRLVLLAALIYPFAVRWNLAGVSFAVLGSTLAVSLFFMCQIARITGHKLLPYAKTFIFPTVNSAIMVLFILLIKRHIGFVNVLNFFVLAGFGFGLYLLLTFLTDKVVGYHFFTSFKELIRNR